MNILKKVTNVVMFLTAFALVANQVSAMQQDPQGEEIVRQGQRAPGMKEKIIAATATGLCFAMIYAMMYCAELKYSSQAEQQLLNMYDEHGNCLIPRYIDFCSRYDLSSSTQVDPGRTFRSCHLYNPCEGIEATMKFLVNSVPLVLGLAFLECCNIVFGDIAH